MRWLAPFVPFAWEQRLAQSVIAPWQGQELPEARQRRVWLQDLAARLQTAMQWPADIPVTVHWINSDMPNAFATLGGHIFIYQGLLDRVDSENAVAMVLAHEMAHIKHRDPIVSLGAGLTVQLVLQTIFGSNVVGTSGSISGEAASTLSQLGFSRWQERAADAAALDALQAHYGHLADADAFFTSMLCEEGRGGIVPEFLHTHPDTQTRVQTIRARAAASKPRQALPLPAFMQSKNAAGKKTRTCDAAGV